MKPPPAAQVACNACRLCCIGEIVMLHPEHGDLVDAFETREMFDPTTGRWGRALEQKPNGECLYLDLATGCTIHERAPSVCRVFSCVSFYLDSPRAERRRRAKAIPGAAALYERAREILRGEP